MTTLAVENYRSLRRLVVPLAALNVVTGANGSGKSSLYRALRLLADAARNGTVAVLAREGGLPSTLWAGPERTSRSVREGSHPVQPTVRTEVVSLRLGFAGDDFGYAVDLGLPAGGIQTAFALDPEFKRESIWSGPVLRPAALLCDRHNQTAARSAPEHRSWAPTGRTLPQRCRPSARSARARPWTQRSTARSRVAGSASNPLRTASSACSCTSMGCSGH
jgi:predicted ATPase